MKTKTTVDIVIYPGFKAVEAVGAINVFDYANTRLRQLGCEPKYELRLVAPHPGAIRSDTLVSLEATHALAGVAPADVVVVVGARDIVNVLGACGDIVSWCRTQAGRLRTIVGLCSGSFFLAEAGLLAGRRAATHWSVAELMRTRYPGIRVDADAIFVRDAHIWTSAGVTAVFDLVLAMVEEDLGRDIALSVARDLVVYLKRPGGQSQFSEHLLSQMTGHPRVRDIQDYIHRTPRADLSVQVLAQRFAMSERNLSRVFLKETGHTPSAYVERTRLDAARRLLEDSSQPLKWIAVESGFGSEARLRQAFQRRLHVTPGAYRERFASTGVDDAAGAG
ncbi:GlxA family transcriptional regulator [Cupriavidus neocaledonicus]|uniref:DJ-1/PfpI family protein/transcriptional regulator, AraC family n=1 Tax=Cupriavidus neocaledonicus TaxID=1040979 RepID=A0A375H592_9BURK|nr:helix-turn-helix domain-containing protein [Cupriavidus neocaledonicus]SOZ34782.1 DJ-1/PfpI family protein/transcriptional regulator, AraC family [Cupriavidus neocaledonicus]SPD46852.1 Transcriptional regulator, AraC family with amidase-like domain [Cupriavidus neocaledonicus]